MIANSIASIYRGLKSCFSPILDSYSTDKVSIEVYEIQFFKTDFTPIRK